VLFRSSTKSVLDKGARNVEILKQGQFSPLRVEQQIAIIYCGTRNLLREVPVNKVRNFEKDFLDVLEKSHKGILDQLKKGQYTDEITNTLEQVAKEVSKRFKA
jgi:F-type H+-transporting ATPase subunit alpha